MVMTAQELGARGEDAAAAYLERNGMEILERRWRCKAGEVDIVALDGAEIVGCMLLVLAMLVLWRDEKRPTQPRARPAKPEMVGATRISGR